MLRTLPGPARRRLPWRMRHPARWVASLALLVRDRRDRARGRRRADRTAAPAWRRASPRTRAWNRCRSSQTAAHDYNPFGTGPENRDQIDNVVDSDPNTTWSTEQYYDGTLKKAGGVGLGIYLDAAPGVLAKAIEIQTPTPGFAVQIYVADHIDWNCPTATPTPLTRARLAGTGRRERRRPRRRTHPAGAVGAARTATTSSG